MKKTPRKLALHRDTISNLERSPLGNDDLEQVAGGYVSQYGNRSCKLSCPATC
jgi:hypothetical protein